MQSHLSLVYRESVSDIAGYLQPHCLRVSLYQHGGPAEENDCVRCVCVCVLAVSVSFGHTYIPLTLSI